MKQINELLQFVKQKIKKVGETQGGARSEKGGDIQRGDTQRGETQEVNTHELY